MRKEISLLLERNIYKHPRFGRIGAEEEEEKKGEEETKTERERETRIRDFLNLEGRNFPEIPPQRVSSKNNHCSKVHRSSFT